MVDAARDPLGVFKDAGDGIVGEEGASRETGDLDVVADVADGLLEIEGREVIADGEALVEGLVDGKTQSGAEVRVTDEQQGGEGLGIHLGGEEETQLLEAEKASAL